MAARSISRICGWMVGSPPLNWTTSGWASSSTNRSSMPSASCSVRLYPLPALAKHVGQERLHAVFTSIRARQVCCLCSGHRPQSSGQPSFTSVLYPRGAVPGLLYFCDDTYASASS